jgi:hypothetical protein
MLFVNAYGNGLLFMNDSKLAMRNYSLKSRELFDDLSCGRDSMEAWCYSSSKAGWQCHPPATQPGHASPHRLAYLHENPFNAFNKARSVCLMATQSSHFKSKKYEMKEKGEVAILLSFVAAKEVIATTAGEKQTDVHLFIYGQDKK